MKKSPIGSEYSVPRARTEHASLAVPTVVDWIGFPQRPDTCLGLIRQEQYLEWRVVRGGDGKLRTMEFTTETLEYWRTLAVRHPMPALAPRGGEKWILRT